MWKLNVQDSLPVPSPEELAELDEAHKSTSEQVKEKKEELRLLEKGRSAAIWQSNVTAVGDQSLKLTCRLQQHRCLAQDQRPTARARKDCQRGQLPEPRLVHNPSLSRELTL